MKDSHISDLFIKVDIKTDNQLIILSDSSYQDCPDTGRSTRDFTIFYQGGTIDHGTHVPGPVSQSNTGNE